MANTFYRSISFNKSKLLGPVRGILLPVQFTAANFTFTNTTTDGGDFRFYEDVSQRKPLRHINLIWDKAGSYGLFMVEVPKLTTRHTKNIYVFYGDDSLTAISTDFERDETAYEMLVPLTTLTHRISVLSAGTIFSGQKSNDDDESTAEITGTAGITNGTIADTEFGISLRSNVPHRIYDSDFRVGTGANTTENYWQRNQGVQDLGISQHWQEIWRAMSDQYTTSGTFVVPVILSAKVEASLRGQGRYGRLEVKDLRFRSTNATDAKNYTVDRSGKGRGLMSSKATIPTIGSSSPRLNGYLLLDGDRSLKTDCYFPFGASSFTFEAWIAVSGVSATAHLFTCDPLSVSITTAPRIVIDWDGGSARTSLAGFALDGSWHHVVLVRDTTQNEIRFYLDGDLYGFIPWVGIQNPGSLSRLIIGANSESGDNDNFNTAKIDWFTFSNVPRDARWVRAQYAAGLSPTNLVTVGAEIAA